MHPLHQTIAPCEIEFFLIAAVAIARVAVIAVTENQRRQIVGKVSAQRDLVRAPELIDSHFQSVCGVVLAAGMNIVRRIWNFNGTARKSALGATRRKRHDGVVSDFLVRGGWSTGLISATLIDVLAVVE